MFPSIEISLREIPCSSTSGSKNIHKLQFMLQEPSGFPEGMHMYTVNEYTPLDLSDP